MDFGLFGRRCRHGVAGFVLAHEFGCLGLAHFINNPDQVSDPVAVHRIAELHLGGNLVSFGYRHLAHVVAKPAESRPLPIMPGGGGAAPGAKLLLDVLVLPEADHHFAIEAHPAHDEAVFAIAMSRLVEVHEIHVDGAPWDLAVVLSMEVGDGLAKLLQAVDPHLGRREGVAPGDEANAVGSGIRLLAKVGDLLGSLGDRLEDHPDWEGGAGVKGLGDFL